jgi:elongation factor P
MMNVQDMRKGMAFKFEGDMWSVMSTQHVTPGKGGAFVKIRARSMSSGNSKEINFRSGEKIENIDVFEKSLTYLYKEGSEFVFMDDETYEQYHVEPELCEEVEKYVILNGKVMASIYESTILTINPPKQVILKVISAEPAVKGDTSTRAMKYVELETGYKLLAPLFIKESEMLKIDTETGDYLERVNS